MVVAVVADVAKVVVALLVLAYLLQLARRPNEVAVARFALPAMDADAGGVAAVVVDVVAPLCEVAWAFVPP